MNILFVCSGNAVRSQMAEGWARYLGGDIFQVKSAGFFVGSLHPLAVDVMNAAGIDISHHQAKPISNNLIEWADVIISVCDTVKPFCAFFDDSVTHHHWSIPNPDALANDDLSQEEAYARVRDEIRDRIKEFIKSLQT